MTNEILIALLSFVGTLIGTLGGILAANKLTTFRIERLEEKVNKHNNIIERTYKLEGKVAEIEDDMKDVRKKILGG